MRCISADQRTDRPSAYTLIVKSIMGAQERQAKCPRRSSQASLQLCMTLMHVEMHVGLAHLTDVNLRISRCLFVLS